jgi:hypothetical protein
MSVNVGMGATDPMAKLNKFIGALTAYANVQNMQLQNVNNEEIGKEIFGLAGYRDGARFTKQAEGELPPQVQQALQQAQQHIQQAQADVAQKEQALGQKMQDMALTEKDIENALSDIAAAKKELQLMEQLAMQKIEEAQNKLDMDAQVREAKINENASAKLEAIAVRESAIYQNMANKSEPKEVETTGEETPQDVAVDNSGQQALAMALQGFQVALEKMGAPKQVVRDANNRIIGVQ